MIASPGLAILNFSMNILNIFQNWLYIKYDGLERPQNIWTNFIHSVIWVKLKWQFHVHIHVTSITVKCLIWYTIQYMKTKEICRYCFVSPLGNTDTTFLGWLILNLHYYHAFWHAINEYTCICRILIGYLISQLWFLWIR